jgi:hypothetical protein
MSIQQSPSLAAEDIKERIDGMGKAISAGQK